MKEMEMVSSPRPPRPGPAATATGARKPSARCSSALGWVVAMNVLLAATQIAVGSAVKSLALVADGVHTLSDALAAYVAHLAETYESKAFDRDRWPSARKSKLRGAFASTSTPSTRRPLINVSTHRWPFGYSRASTVGALINVAALEALCFSIALHATCRMFDPEPIGSLKWLALTSLLGVLINGVSAVLTCCGVRGAHVHLGHGSAGYEGLSISEDGQPKGSACVCCAPIVPSPLTPRKLSVDGEVTTKPELGVGRLALVAHLAGDAVTCAVVLAEALVLKYAAPKLPRRTRRLLLRYLDPSLSLILGFAIGAAAWPVGARAARNLLDESAQPGLKGRLAALDGVLKVDGAALLVLRDQPFAAAGLAHLIAADARSAEVASKKARELFREIGAREMYVDVRLAPAALSAPGAGWARTKRPLNGAAMV